MNSQLSLSCQLPFSRIRGVIASTHCQHSLLALLLARIAVAEYGFDPNVRDCYGYSPFIHACCIFNTSTRDLIASFPCSCRVASVFSPRVLETDSNVSSNERPRAVLCVRAGVCAAEEDTAVALAPVVQGVLVAMVDLVEGGYDLNTRNARGE